MRIYDADKEERLVEESILHEDKDFLMHVPANLKAFDFSLLFQEGDTTLAAVSEDPYERNLSVFPNDATFYRELFEQLLSDRQTAPGQALVDGNYVEIINDPELDRILYDIPL